MSMPQKKDFPPEIFDHIFGFLQSDPTTLVKCSRTHPILSPFAERFLYADIAVFGDANLVDDEDYRTFQARDLHKLLTDSPHIASNVRKLEIHLPDTPTEDQPSSDDITPILPLLLQLNHISVTCDTEGQWPYLSAEFRDAFTNRLRSPDSILAGVSINFFDNFPLSVFDGCQTLRSITLYGCTGENDSQVPPYRQPVLDSLSLRDWQTTHSEFLDWTRKHIHSLRSLSLHSRYLNKLLPVLVRTCSDSLRSLDLHLFDEFRTYFDADGTTVPLGRQIRLDLSSITQLRYLTIGANLFVRNESEPSSGGYHCAFPAIIELLKTTPYLNNLVLKFSIHFTFWEKTYNLIDWAPLLNFLSRSSYKFRRIELRLSLRVSSEHVVASADTLPRLYHLESFWDMTTKGILGIISTEEWDDF